MVVASALFASVFYLSGSLAESPETVLAWRMSVTLVCYALVLFHPLGRRMLKDYFAALRSTGHPALMLCILALLVGVQLWLFSWAPAHGQALDASLGFLLMPMTLVLAGRLVMRDPVTRLQWAAVAIAAVAVALKFALTPEISWVTPAICLGYPIYFILRRRFLLNSPIAFGVEAALIAPLAILLACSTDHTASAADQIVPLAITGLAGTAAMAVYLAASRALTLPLFGLLGYLEPVMLIGVALWLGERILPGDFATYGLLTIALAILAIEPFRSGRFLPTRRPPRSGT